MDAKNLTINENFFLTSSFAENIKDEQHDNSYGLIYDQFFHDIGMYLDVDIIWDHADELKWVIAKDREMDIILLDKGEHERKEIQFKPKTKEALKKIESAINYYKEEFGEFLT